MADNQDIKRQAQEQYLAKGSQGPGILGGIAKAGASMLAFGLGISIFKSGTVRLNYKMGTLLKEGVQRGGWLRTAVKTGPRWARRSSTAFRRAIHKIGRSPGTFKDVTKSAAANIKLSSSTKVVTGKDWRLTNIISRMDSFQNSKIGKTVNKLNDFEKKFLYSANNYSKMKQNALFGSLTKKGKNASITKTLSARAWRYFKTEAPTVPLFYATDRLIGRNERNRGKWYEADEVGSFLTSFVSSDILFRGAMPLAKQFAKSGIGQSVGNAFISKTKGTTASIVSKALSFGSRQTGKHPLAFIQAMKATSASVHPSRANGPIDFTTRVIQGAKTFKHNYSTKMRYLKDVEKQKGSQFGKTAPQAFLDKMSEISGTKDNNPARRSQLKDIRRLGYKDLGKDPNAKMTGWVNKLLGFTGNEGFTEKILASSYIERDGHKLYKGKGFLKYKGEEFNVSSILPSNILKMSLDITKQVVRPFGHSATDLLNMTSISNWALNKEQVLTMGAGTNVNTGVSYHIPGQPKNMSTFGRMFRKLGVKQRGGKKLNATDSYQQYLNEAETIGHKIVNNTAEFDPRFIGKKELLRNEVIDSASRGEYVVGRGQKVHNLLGRMYLQTPKGQKGYSELFQMGINPKTGNQLRYRSLPISGGVFVNVHDKFMGGSETHSVDQFTGKSAMVHTGYGGNRLSTPSGSDTVAGQMMHRINRSLDLGGKESPSIFKRMINFFKSFKDPSESRVFFHDEFMNSPHINDIIKGDPSTVKKYGHMVGGKLDTLNAYSYGKLFDDEKALTSAKSFLEQQKLGYGKFIVTPTQLSTMTLDEIKATATNVVKSNIYRDESNRSLRKAVSTMLDISDGVMDRTLFDVTRKIAKQTSTQLDDYNRTVISQSIRLLDESGLEKMSKHMMEGRYQKPLRMSRWLRAFSGTSHNGSRRRGETLASVFDDVADWNLSEKSSKLQSFIEKANEYSPEIDHLTKKMRPIWKMGSTGSEYKSPQVRGVRTRLFIPEKTDVGGIGVNQGSMSDIFPKRMPDQNLLNEEAFATDVVTLRGLMSGAALDSVNRIANVIGLGFSGKNSADWKSFGKSLITKRVLPAMAIGTAWRAADALVDDADIFEGSSLDEGLNVFVASQFMKGRLASARVMDATGITNLSQYAEDLLPGSIKSPLSGAVRGFGSPLVGAAFGMRMAGPAGGLAGGAIGGIISLLTAGGPIASVGAWDITKSRKELIEEYSGRKKVPYSSSRNWILGSTPMIGMGTDFFTQNWYARVRSQYQNTPTLYGSKIERLLAPFDTHHYEEKNYMSRPYPTTGGHFSKVPLVGNIISFGNQQMHADELNKLNLIPGQSIEGSITNGSDSYSNVAYMGANAIGSNAGNMGVSPFINGTTILQHPQAMAADAVQAKIGAAFYGATELAGLRGFLGQAMWQKATGNTGPFSDIPILDNAATMTSPSKWYWDQAIGDPMGLCLDGETLIETLYGQKKLKNIIINDMVRTGDGSFQKVIDTISYSKDTWHKNGKKIKNIKIGVINRNIIGTDNHWIPIWKRPKYSNGHVKPFDVLDVQLVDTQIKNIEKGDYAGYPIFDNGNDNIIMDFSEYPKSFIFDGKLYIPIENIEDITDKFNESVYDITVENNHTYIANGIIVHNTEGIRRAIPNKQTGKTITNPIPNLQPGWMPSRFRMGDPYKEIPLGEIRLPGAGWESINDVDITFPGDIDVIGEDMDETVSNFLFGSRDTTDVVEVISRTKERLTEELGTINGEAKQSQSFFMPTLNLSGTADVVSGNIAYKIKTLTPEQFDNLNSITPDMAVKLNILSNISNGLTGVAVYVNPQTGETKEFAASSSKDKFMQDVAMMERAKNQAKSLVNDKSIQANMNLGNAYSRLDRLKILGDIAPKSKEFFDAFKQVNKLRQIGAAPSDVENQLDNIQRQVFIKEQPKALYPYRFSKTEGNDLANLARVNEINREYNPIERSIGKGWEYLSHINTPIHKKFMDINSPYEAYTRGVVFGKDVKLWDRPYQHFIRPYMGSVTTRTDPIQNAISVASAGFVFGGPVGATVGAGLGATFALHNSITGGSRELPKYRQKERDINTVFDEVDYRKNMEMYKLTGNQLFLNNSQRTMKSVNQNIDAVTIEDFQRSAPYAENAYTPALMKTRNKEERDLILQTIPENMRQGVSKFWNRSTADQYEVSDQAESLMNQISPSWAGWLPDNKLEIMKTKILNNSGLDARDSGVGWHSQISEMNRSVLTPEDFTTNLKVNFQGIGSKIQSALSNLGIASVTASPIFTSGVTVNLTIVRTGTR